MGFYIEGVKKGKADFILSNYDAFELQDAPLTFESIPSDWALICVVDNGPFEAAAYCFSQMEFKVFTQPSDNRPKRWLVMEKVLARTVSGCPY